MRVLIKFSNLKIIFFVCLSLLFLHVFIIQNVLFCVECENNSINNDKFIITYESKTTESSNALHKRVTKSLSDMKKLIKLNDHVLMFNHGPKSGSEMFVLILKWLQGPNNFRHFRIGKDKKQKGVLSSIQQKQVSEFVSKSIQDLATPMSFDSSSYFINFTQYGWDSPTHFSIIRDPGEILKASSKPTDANNDIPEASNLDIKIDPADLNIPYFCGHHLDCTMLNSNTALVRAKENVEKFYPLVGVIEHIDETLYVLENKFKYFFKGATDIYQKKFRERHIQWLKKLDKNEVLMKEIVDVLHNEYNFYNWIKSRLFDQVTFYQRQLLHQNNHRQTVKITNLKFQIEEP